MQQNTDKNALGYDADTKTEAHTSQTSFSKGYGGKFGVQQATDKVQALASRVRNIQTNSRLWATMP